MAAKTKPVVGSKKSELKDQLGEIFHRFEARQKLLDQHITVVATAMARTLIEHVDVALRGQCVPQQKILSFDFNQIVANLWGFAVSEGWEKDVLNQCPMIQRRQAVYDRLLNIVDWGKYPLAIRHDADKGAVEIELFTQCKGEE